MSRAENYESDILNEILDGISPSDQRKVEKRMLIAQKIIEGIKAKGWKKIDFAGALHKRPSEITKWLSVTHNFNIDTLFEIEEILGIHIIDSELKPKEQVIKFHLTVNQSHILSRSGCNENWLSIAEVTLNEDEISYKYQINDKIAFSEC